MKSLDDNFADISGLSFLKLKSGSIRIKIGKKLTGDKIITKTCKTESEAYEEARYWSRESIRMKSDSRQLSEANRIEMVRCLDLLEDNEIRESIYDIVKEYCNNVPESTTLTVEEAFTNYTDYLDQAGKDSRQAKSHSKKFLKIYKDHKLNDLCRLQIEDFLQLLIVENYSPKTRNHYLGTLSAICNREISYKRLRSNPCEHIPKLEIIKEITILKQQEVHDILRYINKNHEEKILLFYAFQAFAGLRRAEVFRLTWNDIKSEELRITKYSTRKTKGRAVPILTGLSVILEKINAWGTGQSLIFKGLSQAMLGRRLNDAYKSLNIENPGRNVFRHCFVSYRVASTKDQIRTAFEANHSIRTQQESYAALAEYKEGIQYFNFTL